ncbi:hypothetical protein SPLC1_S130400 [Arthrospira platensis C1]|nr:hypothetical protein SPLC1_S130400 [Arthrospira platensis C1]
MVLNSGGASEMNIKVPQKPLLTIATPYNWPSQP